MTDEQLAACHEAGREIVRLTAERDEAVALLVLWCDGYEDEGPLDRPIVTDTRRLLARLAPPATKPEGM